MLSRRTFSKAAAAGLSVAALPVSATTSGSRWHMPEESEPHARTFMQWPVSRIVHPDRWFLDDLQGAIARIANVIADFEPVVMLMDERHAARARQKLSSAVEIWPIPTEDLWARDSGPVFLKNPAGELAVTHFNFNGWGGKQVHEQDGEVARRIAQTLGLPVIESHLTGEAGGLEFNGEDLIIAHESSWVNPNRNPGLSRDEISRRMARVLGAKQVIWAPGVAGADITDYHIDSLARFTDRRTVVIQLPPDIRPDDPWSASAFETYDILDAVPGLELVELPEPQTTRVQSANFVASYVNYYVCNGAIISAQFGDSRADREAAETLAALYPGREIIALNVDPVGEVGGGIHCATQQQPV